MIVGLPGQRAHPVGPRPVHPQRVGHEDVGDAVLHEHLGLADGGHGDADGAGRELAPGDLGGLVGLHVRPQVHARRRGPGGAVLDVRLEAGHVDGEVGGCGRHGVIVPEDGPMEQNPEIGLSVDVGGIATNYHRAGDGPPVVLIHGSGPGVSAWANWRLNIDALAEQNTVYAPDVVGFGFTDRPAGFTYGMDAWRAHLVGFADALGLDRFSLVGNSFGGALALSVATSAPDRVDRWC